MNNRATVFSGASPAIQGERFAIVQILPRPVDSRMPNESENPLADYVSRVMQENELSSVDVEKAARERGGSLGRSTVQQIANGKTPNPGIFTLVELAWGIKKPVEDIVLVALANYMEDTSAFNKSELSGLWEMSKQLSPGDRQFFKRLIQMIEREVRRLLGSK